MSDENQSDRNEKTEVVVRTIGDYNTYARTARQAGTLETAGRYYVAAAHGSLMRFRQLPDDLTDIHADLSPRYHDFGSAIRYLLLGALCFRLDGALDRCRRHCEQGESIVSDLFDEPYFTTDAEIGFCHEVQGDFRLVGDLGSHDEAYALAADKYERVANDLGWSLEPGFEDAIQIPVELAGSVGMGLETAEKNEIMYTSLEARIGFKRSTYPEIIDAVEADGNWNSEVL